MKFISGKKWWKVVMSMFMGNLITRLMQSEADHSFTIPGKLGQEFVMTKLDGCLFVFHKTNGESFKEAKNFATY